MADHEQGRAWIDLGQSGGHLAHRNVLGSGGVAALPLVVLPDVEEHDRGVERRRNVGHVYLLDAHALMLRGGFCRHTSSSNVELSTVSTGSSTGRRARERGLSASNCVIPEWSCA